MLSWDEWLLRTLFLLCALLPFILNPYSVSWGLYYLAPEVGRLLRLYPHPSQYEGSKRDNEPRFLLSWCPVLSLIAWADRCCSTFYLCWVNYSDFEGQKWAWWVLLEKNSFRLTINWSDYPILVSFRRKMKGWSGMANFIHTNFSENGEYKGLLGNE